LEHEIPARSPSPPDDPVVRADGFEPQRPIAAFTVQATRQRFQHKFWKHVLLFVFTLLSTTLAGACHYEAFVSDFSRMPVTLGLWGFLLNGLWYSGTILAILGAHEFGHYYLCRKYNVDATLPYFLPAPLLTGTLGAVIRIREPFPTRTALFDIGVAGPIAGFVVLVPALFLGMMLSNVTPEPPISAGLVSLGEPMLFRLAERLVFGALPEGQALNIHPIVFAAWFGMLATALNLLPFGQLDGGHISYATIGRWSTPLSLATVLFAVAMTFVSTSWMFMTAMMVVMLVLLGPRHPRVIYEYEPLGPGRKAIAVIAVIMLIICFTPAPIEPYELIGSR